MFTTCSRALAQGGRLVVIGMMSQYSDGWAPSKVRLISFHAL
jgi:NADPH-dependent curcumin reductase CurA